MTDAKVSPPKHYLDTCGATWLQLERVQSAKAVRPVYSYVNSDKVRGGVHVYQGVLRTGGVLHHGSVLASGVHRYGEV